MDLMAEFAKKRYEESIATNPNFYYGPFTGAIARNAGYVFAGRLFRNHSIENPEGVLSRFYPSPWQQLFGSKTDANVFSFH